MIDLLKTESECIEYIHSAGRFGKKAGLDNINALLNHIGNPQRELKCIHIAGTNGKGSVSSMLCSVLRSKGYKVGMNTSPFIEVFNERLTVNGENIPAEKLIHYTNLVADAMEKLDIHPIEFEIITAIGFKYFMDERVDYAIIECGLGGLYDCTNVIEKPTLCAITSIGLDHTEILGNTLEDIAFQKAGIIKEGVPVVVNSAIDAKALRIIEEVAKEKNAPLALSEDFSVLSSTLEGTLMECGNEKFKLPLIGSYQPYNASLVATIANCLGVEDISEGMAKARWKCRFERVEERIIIDGAHNYQGISAFCQSVASFVPQKDRVLLVGMLNDKDFENSAKLLAELGSPIVVTDVPSYRQTSGENVYECIKKFCPHAIYEPDNRKALTKARQMTGDEGFLCIAGSLYLAGVMRTMTKNGLFRAKQDNKRG